MENRAGFGEGRPIPISQFIFLCAFTFAAARSSIKKTWNDLHFVACLLLPISFSFSNTTQLYTLFWRDGAGFGVGAFLSDIGGHWGTSLDI